MVQRSEVRWSLKNLVLTDGKEEGHVKLNEKLERALIALSFLPNALRARKEQSPKKTIDEKTVVTKI